MSDQGARPWRAVHRVPLLDRWLRRLRRSEEIESLQRQVAALRGTDAEPFLARFPPGHFYSPVPNMKDIVEHDDQIFGRHGQLDAIELNEDAQLGLLKLLAPMANAVTFPTRPQADVRYYTDNPGYGPGDAAILHAMLRHLRPARYLEVGSGWSTALVLDTNDRWLDGKLRVTCIEPYPEDHLNALLRPQDDVEVIASPVQDVDLRRFQELRAGDILFIDCSHVVKTGSDSHFLITQVLPVVPAGVYVHIHDIFWPFEYPRDWVHEGRAWSEAYLVHAFLLFNPAFEIVLFNDWLMHERLDVLAREVPHMADGAGAALWLRRRV